jgi:chromosome segregation ATPase
MLGCMNKKITTIEDLAVMIEGEFRGIEKRFDMLEVRMDKLETRMDKLEARIGKIESEIAKMSADIAQLRKDLKDADTRTAVIAIELRVSDLEKKIDLSAKKI